MTNDLLATGEIEVLGLLPYSSNYTFLVRVFDGAAEALAVYKPQQGERPLWDFPEGTLARREVAAYVVSEAAGWHLVPETVLRAEAPHGPGSLQRFIDHDPQRHYFTLEPARAAELRVFAAFDAVINNADRKSGHVIEDSAGRLWAVDHGVSFHVEPKLRTVIWDFAETPLTAPVVGALTGLLERFNGVAGELSGLLSGEEVAATRRRIAGLLAAGAFPAPQGPRPLPWPLV